MRIAFFSDCFLDLTGGIVTTISAQKRELESRGHTVYLFSSSYPKSRKELQKLAKDHIFSVKSCRVFGRGLTPIARRPKVIEKQLLRTHPELKNFDIFYVHYEAGCSIAGLRLGKKLGIRTIQVMHGREDVGEQNLVPFGFKTIVAALLNLFHSWYIPHPTKIRKDHYLATTTAAAKMWTLMVNHANFADLVLTPSTHFKTKLQKYGVRQPIRVLPNGVADGFFKPNLAPRILLPDETLKVIWHSRVSKEKRIIPFLKALEYIEGKYRLDVYGDGNDLRLAKKYAKNHHLEVEFHGAAPFKEVYPKIIESHLDVLNSYGFDTFGMTLIEAESAGTPVLFVDPDLKEIAPSSGSILANSPSPTSVANAINDLIRNPDKIERMSEVMLKKRDSVRISKVVDTLESYFKTI